jgi:hypothetical protein
MINLDLNIEKKSTDLFNSIEKYITLNYKKNISEISLHNENFFSVFIDDYSKKEFLSFIKPYSGKIYLTSIKINSKFYPLVQINISDDFINFNLKIDNEHLKYNWTMELIQPIIVDIDKIFLFLLDDLEKIRFSNIKKKYSNHNRICYDEELLSLKSYSNRINTNNFNQNKLMTDIEKFNNEYNELIIKCLQNYKMIYNSQNNSIEHVTFIIEINTNDIPEVKRLLKLTDIKFNIYINVLDKLNESDDYLKGSIKDNFNLIKNQKLYDILIFSDFNNLKYFINNIEGIIDKFNSRKYLGILGKNLDTFNGNISKNSIYFSILENRPTGIIIGDLPMKLKKLENLKAAPKLYFNKDFNFCCVSKLIKNINKNDLISNEDLLKTISNSCYKNRLSIKHLID